MGLTQEEKEVLFRILSDVKINPLDGNAATIVAMLQSIGRKVIAADQKQPEADDFNYPADETPKKASKKQA